ncbi:hypothetical protein [Roseivirga sp.]|uniref:hypothetical protein n=1 Tax=Roseivirga sp. TaxID=1964215 RepID=UPI003B8B040B
MIICKDFILLNNPKTGSTYARAIIKEVYKYKGNFTYKALLKLGLLKPEYLELKHPNLEFPKRPKNQHGTYAQIPDRHKEKDVLSIVRDPYDKFVSTYEYRYWLKRRPDETILKELQIQDLSKITIDDFVRIQLGHIKRKHPILSELQIGGQTLHFILMFFKEPYQVLQNLSEDFFYKGHYKEHLGNVNFLDQRKLSNQLFQYLETKDISDQAMKRAREVQPINKNNNRASIDKYRWSEFSLDYVSVYERFLFFMLKELGFEYAKPSFHKEHAKDQ